MSHSGGGGGGSAKLRGVAGAGAGQHNRMSSLDSTTSSEESSVPTPPAHFHGSVTSLASVKDHYGSITSLASSTSMISPQVRIDTIITCHPVPDSRSASSHVCVTCDSLLCVTEVTLPCNKVIVVTCGAVMCIIHYRYSLSSTVTHTHAICGAKYQSEARVVAGAAEPD